MVVINPTAPEVPEGENDNVFAENTVYEGCVTVIAVVNSSAIMS
jgi:hypothetical protein